MAGLRNPLLRKLKKVLLQRFPDPATIKLDDCPGIIGVITSDEFSAIDTLDRQKLIREYLKTHLSPEERRQIQIIVAVTPDEGTGYLATVD